MFYIFHTNHFIWCFTFVVLFINIYFVCKPTLNNSLMSSAREHAVNMALYKFCILLCIVFKTVPNIIHIILYLHACVPEVHVQCVFRYRPLNVP